MQVSLARFHAAVQIKGVVLTDYLAIRREQQGVTCEYDKTYNMLLLKMDDRAVYVPMTNVIQFTLKPVVIESVPEPEEEEIEDVKPKTKPKPVRTKTAPKTKNKKSKTKLAAV